MTQLTWRWKMRTSGGTACSISEKYWQTLMGADEGLLVEGVAGDEFNKFPNC